MTTSVVLTHRWLNTPSGAPIFTADARSLRVAWNLTPRMQVRVIAQHVETRALPSREGFQLGSILFSYRLNWQTAVYCGYDDRRLITDDPTGAPDARKAYVKLSYAIGR